MNTLLKLTSTALVLSLTLVGTASAKSNGHNPDERDGQRHELRSEVLVEVAENFQMSPETLENELSSGSTLRDVAREYNVSEETLKDTMVAIDHIKGSMWEKPAKTKNRNGKNIGEKSRWGQHDRQEFFSHAEVKAEIADYLGVSVKELEAAHQNGASLKAMLREQEINMKDFRGFLQDLWKDFRDSL